MRFERNSLKNGNLNCFGLGLSLRNENKLFFILKEIYGGFFEAVHTLFDEMLKAIFMKGLFLQTSIL